MVLRGPDISAQTRVNIVNGKVVARLGIGATWTLKATKAGTYTIGPGSVVIDGKVKLTRTVRVSVRPTRMGPSPKPFDPFDPFSFPGMPKLPGLGGAAPDDEEDEDEISLLPPYPSEYRLDRAADKMAFVHAEVTPRRAVVGQQVTLTVYAYGKRGPFRETHTAEPSREAFLAYTLLENSYSEPMYRVPVAQSVWHAKKVRELALFPIRAGKLAIGAMRMGFEGRGYPSDGPHRGLVRYSNAIELQVDEPPLKGRPAGYKLGDVGSYTLTAKVTPRKIAAGEAVSVVAKLEGTGNVPFSLKVPQQHQVEWLEPNVLDKVEPRGLRIGGYRKFSYVVRIDAPGNVELGDLTIPFWDPERGQYKIASANLGRVSVGPGTTSPKDQPSPKSDPLATLGSPRKSLGAQPGASAPLSRGRWFFPGLLLAPLLVVSAYGATRGVQALRRRSKATAESPAKLAKVALAEARHAQKDGDPATTATRVESALFLALEHATGIRARAVLKSELASELSARGLGEGLVARTEKLLAACDDARFSDKSAESELYAESRKLINELLRRAPHRSEA